MLHRYDHVVNLGSQHFAWINVEAVQSSETSATLKNLPYLIDTKGEIVGINNVVSIVLY